MAHGLIFGTTESGKTTLAKTICRELTRKGWKTLILDPLHDPGWKGSFQVTDIDRFIKTAKASRRCFLFVDEAGMNCGQWDKESLWLATQSRHWGHSCFFISQRAMQISKTIREQCRFLYLFACGKSDSRILADDWNKEELLQANTLKRGEYLYTSRFGEVVKKRIF